MVEDRLYVTDFPSTHVTEAYLSTPSHADAWLSEHLLHFDSFDLRALLQACTESEPRKWMVDRQANQDASVSPVLAPADSTGLHAPFPGLVASPAFASAVADLLRPLQCIGCSIPSWYVLMVGLELSPARRFWHFAHMGLLGITHLPWL